MYSFELKPEPTNLRFTSFKRSLM